MNTPSEFRNRPILALTMGDAAGVGPEVIAAAVTSQQVRSMSRPLVIGDPHLLRQALELMGHRDNVSVCSSIDDARDLSLRSSDGDQIPCWSPTRADLTDLPKGKLDARCGHAAYDWLVAATHAALDGKIDGIVTAPLNKAALHLAGHCYPGHTEILAHECGVDDFAMMLYLPSGAIVKAPFGLGVAHVTLHTSIASVPGLLSTNAIYEKIHLVDQFLKNLGAESPRIGVCALNPHAGEAGLFGNEEAEIIAPAVNLATGDSIHVSGPLPADTLLQRAVGGAFDGIVAMYHDQGHIALKLIGFQRAVNVTLGLPIIRTSPSHGTAFDIAWQGKCDATGMMEAIRIAVKLVEAKRENQPKVNQ